MDRMRPVHVRQSSSSSFSGAPGSPAVSPLHRSARGAAANVRRPQNNAAKAAHQRLAQAMASKTLDHDDDDDDLDLDYSPMGVGGGLGIGLASGRPRQRSPMTIRTSTEQTPSVRTTSGARSSTATKAGLDKTESIIHNNSVEQPSSARSNPGGRFFQNNSIEQPPPARPVARSPQPNNPNDQGPLARATPASRSSFAVKSVAMVPPSVPLSLRPTSSAPLESPIGNKREKRLSLDMGSINFKESGIQQQSASVLQDELDMLQEENESLLQKLRLAEERSEEAELRAKQLEKQVASLGEGVSMEARLLSRKEAALQQREAALKAVEKTYGGGGTKEQTSTLRMEVESARDEATVALEQLQDAESEIKSLRAITQRTTLSPEEMEEVVLKRCWLAQYWSLCVQHGIHAEIATAKHEYWSSFARHPTEVVVAAGRRAREENSTGRADREESDTFRRQLNEHSKEESMESMLLVEKGLRELVSLKVEDAVAIAMAQQRRPHALRSDDLKLPVEGHYEAFELSQEESQDVVFKQAWLTYFWRRAKNHGLESDIADERLQFWISHADKPPTSHDAVDVARGLVEMRKFGIEMRLWEESRKWIEQDPNSRMQMESDF